MTDANIGKPYPESGNMAVVRENQSIADGKQLRDASTQTDNCLVTVQQGKQQVYNWPIDKKLLKLAVYSACQYVDCKCTGWKTTEAPIQTEASNDTPCTKCSHILELHVSHLTPVSESELNRLLGMVVDVENIHKSMKREEDPVSKRVYFHLFKKLKRCILTMAKPSLDGPLGRPPFERPSIAQAVTNFVSHKFNHLTQREWQTMYELAKLFLYFLNNWVFESPSIKRDITLPPVATSVYEVDYCRWLIFCQVPFYCDSLPHFDTADAFGKTFLKAVCKSVCRPLTRQCHAERDKTEPENLVFVVNHFPRFLSLLEEEVYAVNSPIWDPEFKQIPPAHVQAPIEGEPVVRREGEFEQNKRDAE